MGTFCFTYSQFLADDKLITKIYFDKNEVYSPLYKILENGFHFSHFYDEKRFLEKINLMSDTGITDEEFEKYKLNLEPNGRLNFVIINNDEILSNQPLLPVVEVKLRDKKKNLIVLNFNRNRLPSIDGYDKILNMNFLKVYDNYDSEDAGETTTNYNIFIPQSKLYTSKIFELEFGINELKKIISNTFPLDIDIFDFVTYDEEFGSDTIQFTWGQLKNNLVYNFLENFLIKNPSV